MQDDQATERAPRVDDRIGEELVAENLRLKEELLVARDTIVGHEARLGEALGEVAHAISPTSKHDKMTLGDSLAIRRELHGDRGSSRPPTRSASRRVALSCTVTGPTARKLHPAG